MIAVRPTATLAERARSSVLQLERERLDWAQRCIEWARLGCDLEARYARDCYRIVSRQLLFAGIWLWLIGGSRE
jgi:hypothetical protein